jgi:WhiB family redox-sensing transcriptional regulator
MKPITYGTSTEIHYDWRHYAACLDHNPELFFPIGISPNQTEAAKDVCFWECPDRVRTECLAFANESRAEGIWGGTTQEERDAARRKAARQRRGPL